MKTTVQPTPSPQLPAKSSQTRQEALHEPGKRPGPATACASETDESAPSQATSPARSWTTRSHEHVDTGDLVALSLLRYSDAVGRIVGEAGDGRVQCVLIRSSSGRSGDRVTVEPDQLLVKVYS